MHARMHITSTLYLPGRRLSANRAANLAAASRVERGEREGRAKPNQSDVNAAANRSEHPLPPVAAIGRAACRPRVCARVLTVERTRSVAVNIEMHAIRRDRFFAAWQRIRWSMDERQMPLDRWMISKFSDDFVNYFEIQTRFKPVTLARR